jgi:hypothetical protein
MKDPVTFGAVFSGATMLLLATWKSRVWRWVSLSVAIVALLWVVRTDPMPIAPDLDDRLAGHAVR